MRWLRKSKYHEESEPPRFFVAAAMLRGEWRFSLTDVNELVGWYATAAEAKKQAEALSNGG